ncbi:HypC/HybG/HupF family hydrogenase formation chaperone [Streptomyces sp. GQFP]|nr:HypC/HybG/HupF family hydrogenase formation chaperone [Streptomyces sp. GQFP]UIX34177.1 HypC/HybG/HupF family hydrogenase formation chaperone [Streptomyces sp. GQFP]
MRMGTVGFGGIRREVCLAYTPTAEVTGAIGEPLPVRTDAM